MNGWKLQKTGKIFETQAYAGVWQDKQPPGRLTAERGQPATAGDKAVGQKGGYATAITQTVDRPKHHGSETRQSDQITGRVPRHIKTGLLKVASDNGWTESKIVAVACQAYLEQDLGQKFGVRLAAIVTEAVVKEIQKHSKQETYLSRHGYYAAEVSRIINIRVLRHCSKAPAFDVDRAGTPFYTTAPNLFP